jgi:hypothetical protein
MLLRKLVVVGLVGMIQIAAAQIAMAQEPNAPPMAAVEGVSFADANASDSFTDRFSVAVDAAPQARFAATTAAPWRQDDNDRNDRGFEVALTARGAAGFDVSAAQSRRFGFDEAGDVARESRSAEFRLGRGLQGLRDSDSRAPSWYVFVASEDEALIWRPGGQRNAFGGSSSGFALQDRVEIGDLQAGITYEVYGLQASLAYVEREISVQVGRESVSLEERFAGVTLTLRN